MKKSILLATTLLILVACTTESSSSSKNEKSKDSSSSENSFKETTNKTEENSEPEKSADESKTSYKIGTLEIALTDLSKKMNLFDAKAACANMGSGWRLPTNNELKIMYQNKNKIGGFKNDTYWSGSEPEQNDLAPSGSAEIFDFTSGEFQGLSSGDNPGDFLFFVRPVRSVK
jgi:hypothetical protein